MLVLSRRAGEGIQIGDDILIRVIRIKVKDGDRPSSVQLGIEAPESIKILREEIIHGRVSDKQRDPGSAPGH